ncbi:MAG: murein biosynthesis integral membrane protein MurJ [bacterium]
MSQNLTRKSILKKTAQFGLITFLSRVLGIVREVFIGRLLGVGAMADAFIAAYKIPQFLRRIFAEGALSAAFIPVFVRKVKKGDKDEANGLMSLSFLFFEGIVFILILLAILFPRAVFAFTTPGFSEEQLTFAIPFLRILFPIIFFISSGALFAGALNSVNHIIIPALGPVFMNIFFVGGLALCYFMGFSMEFLCFMILLGGLFSFLMHIFAYVHYNFSFAKPNKSAYKAFKKVISKFLPSLLGVSIIEINLFVDSILSSFLAVGNYSLLYYAGRYMNMPIGIFAVGFATVLLPQFSRYAIYAPKRLAFHILESSKFVTWLILPAMLFLMFISEEIFSILMFKKITSYENILTAKYLLIIYSAGLVFYCLNKVLVNVFYAMNDTKTPTIALVVSTVVNFGVNIIGMIFFGVYGIAFSTAISAIILTVLFFIFLHLRFKFKFYGARFLNFLIRYFVQLFFTSGIFLSLYYSAFYYLQTTDYYSLFKAGWGFWLLVFFAAGVSGLFMYNTRKLFGIKLYFLSK